MFLLHAGIFTGFSGGYAHYGFRVLTKDGGYESPKKEGKLRADYANNGYIKTHFGYMFHITNNLYVSAEGFLGYTFGSFTQNGDPILDPGIFTGLVAKCELDFDSLYSLYCIGGLQISLATMHSFYMGGKKMNMVEEKMDWYLTPIVGIGTSISLTHRISAIIELTYSGYFSGHYFHTKDAPTRPKQFLNDHLRIGAGMIIKLS